jgi:HD-like signal output (HDOD) protein
MSEDLCIAYNNRILEARNLPALPSAVSEITRMLRSPYSSSERIAWVIERDQALSAKVLKVVNSPIYGFPGRISSVKHALVLLGVNVIRGIIISSAIFDAMNKTMMGLWEHSVACSLASVEIAKASGLEHPEEYSVMGLLHDVGKMIFYMQIPEVKHEIDIMVKREDILFMEAEKKLLGFGHDKINAWLCTHWNLPLNLKEALICHHSPTLAAYAPEAASVVHLADFMVRFFECGSGGDDNVPPIEAEALRILNIDHLILEDIFEKLVEIYSDRNNLSII